MAKFVFYAIHADPGQPDTRLTNWAIMARLADGTEPPPRREDWKRPGRLDEVLPFVRDRFRLPFVKPRPLIEATGTFYEYPNSEEADLERLHLGYGAKDEETVLLITDEGAATSTPAEEK